MNRLTQTCEVIFKVECCLNIGSIHRHEGHSDSDVGRKSECVSIVAQIEGSINGVEWDAK